MKTLEIIRQDLRYAWRSYSKTPAFTAAAILTAALAIGANATIFSLINALLLRTLPVRDPGSLVAVNVRTRTDDRSGLSYAMFQELTARQQAFGSVIGAWGISVLDVRIDDAFTRAAVWGATGNVYGDLGVRPQIGRLLAAGDMKMAPVETERVAVLGNGFWHRQFNADPSIVGRTVRLEDVPFTIVGVAPAGFTGFAIRAEPDITIPLPAVALINGRTLESIPKRSSQWIDVVGRLRPGVTLEQARAQLTTIWPRIRAAAIPQSLSADQRAEFLSQDLVVTSAARGIEPSLRARFTAPLAIVFVIAGMILLVACANLASLLLSRTAARGHEIGVRLALGASRWRISRQMMTEGILLALVGGAWGLLFAAWGSRAIAAMIFEDFLIPPALDTAPDVTVMGFTAGVAAVLGMLFSLAPIWRVAGHGPADVLRQNSRTVAGTRRAGRWLVSVQIGCSLVLLINAGLLVRTLHAIRSVSPGLEKRDVMVVFPRARPGMYGKVDNDVYYPEMIGRIEGIPGVQAVSVSLLKPAAGGAGWSDRVASIEETNVLARGIETARTPVAPSFFKVLGIPLLQGRDFRWTDNSRAAKVAVLSTHLATRLFGPGGAIGKRIRVGVDPARQDVEVVGIVGDARLYDLKSSSVDAVYVPALQDPAVNDKCLVVRGAGSTSEEVKRRVESLGQELAGNVQTLDHIANAALLEERITAGLASFCGAFALILAAVGLYGLMSYSVSERRREIGIRMALGAGPRRVVADVVKSGLVVTLAGTAAGLLGALAASRLLESLLFGVTVRDPLTVVGAPACLAAVALAACLVPALRAARVDPMIALRAE